MIDESHIAARVRNLRSVGIPATEGYYLVVLSPTESRELKRSLASKQTKHRYKHPPHALLTSARLQGHEAVCVLGDALVVSADHTRDEPRCSQQPVKISESPRCGRVTAYRRNSCTDLAVPNEAEAGAIQDSS